MIAHSDRDKLVARASYLVSKAVKAGELPHLSTLKCVDCDEQATCYDHRDYHKPLDVVAVCKGCNNRRGPGLPLPEKADGADYKREWLDGSAGHRYSNLDAGEGFIPLSSRLNGITHQELEEALTTLEVEQSHAAIKNIIRSRFQTSMRMFREEGKNTGFFSLHGASRAMYFKERDPWFVHFF